MPTDMHFLRGRPQRSTFIATSTIFAVFFFTFYSFRYSKISEEQVIEWSSPATRPTSSAGLVREVYNETLGVWQNLSSATAVHRLW
jgi:hypothetical protein